VQPGLTVLTDFFIEHLIKILTLKLCSVSVVVGVDAELHERSVADVNQTEDRIISQWTGREISADEKREMHDEVDEILRRRGFETSLLGFQTRLVVIRRANSLALYFICMTLAALMSLRDQWRSRQLRYTVNEIFAFLSPATQTFRFMRLTATQPVRVKRLNWPLVDYQRCLNFFSSVQG